MKIAIVVILYVFVLSSLAFAENIEVTPYGACKDYVLNISSNMTGCWDVKIDAPGEIKINDEWKDTFFFVPNAMCNGTAVLNVKFSSSSDVQAIIKFRQGARSEQGTVTIQQNCPRPLSDTAFLMVIVLFILLLLAVFVWYYIVK